MASIRAWKWERFVPDIGDNRAQERPFFFRIKSGISKVEFRDFLQRVTQMKTGGENALETIMAVFTDLVELGDEPLSINGVEVKTLSEYFERISENLNAQPYFELLGAVKDFNSLEGTRSLFFERLSGGTASTVTPATARAESQTDARSSGSGTSH